MCPRKRGKQEFSAKPNVKMRGRCACGQHGNETRRVNFVQVFRARTLASKDLLLNLLSSTFLLAGSKVEELMGAKTPLTLKRWILQALAACQKSCSECDFDLNRRMIYYIYYMYIFIQFYYIVILLEEIIGIGGC